MLVGIHVLHSIILLLGLTAIIVVSHLIDGDVSYENTALKAFSRSLRHVKHPRGNRFQDAASVVEDSPQEHLMSNNPSLLDAQRHICAMWIPTEALNKYPLVHIKQKDKSRQLIHIEVCCPGYQAMRWRGNILCRPQCKNCRNGLCVAPDQCQCYEEFVKNDNGDCIFTCPIGCLNGRCYLDGRCECNVGYKLDVTRKFCRPICSQGCGGHNHNYLLNCTEPEVCGCAKGYVLGENGCQPKCQPECGLGGHCAKPNVCNCLSGYKLKNGVCQAHCYQKCDNGVCYSQNRCICNAGFIYHERSTMCIPV